MEQSAIETSRSGGAVAAFFKGRDRQRIVPRQALLVVEERAGHALFEILSGYDGC